MDQLSVAVDLNLREGGLISPCRWTCHPEIYKKVSGDDEIKFDRQIAAREWSARIASVSVQSKENNVIPGNHDSADEFEKVNRPVAFVAYHKNWVASSRIEGLRFS